MISSQYSWASRRRLPLLMRLRIISMSSVPGRTMSGESVHRAILLIADDKPAAGIEQNDALRHVVQRQRQQLGVGPAGVAPDQTIEGPKHGASRLKLVPDVANRTSAYASLNKSDTHPAIDHQQASGGEARRVGGEKQHRARYLLGADMAVKRDDLVKEFGAVAADQGAQFALHVQLKGIIDRPGMNGVDADIASGELFGQHAHQSHLGMLGGDVAIDARVARNAGDARRNDDRAAVIHLRHCVFGAEKSASDMHGKHRIEYVLWIFGNRRDGAKIAGVAEQYVDLAEALDGRGDRLADLIRFGDIGRAPGNLATDIRGGLLQRRLIQIDQHDPGTLVPQQPG